MKTGLNFYTTTIINSNKFNGKDRIVADTNKLVIKPGMTFEKDNIQKVSYKEGYEGKMASVTLDLSGVDANTYYRLDIYVKVQGAEPYIYATPWIQKGRPFWIEFKGSQVSKLESIISKEHLFQVGDDQITAKVSSNKLTLTATSDYLRFAKVELVKLNEDGDDTEVVAITKSDEVVGKNAFGSYSQIIKDVQLPTAENTRWLHLRQDETPVVGAIYDQFIIEYAAPANNRPLGAVGCEVTSHTTHVFWIKHDLTATVLNLFKSTLKINVSKINDTTGKEEVVAAEQNAVSGQAVVNSQLGTKSSK